MIICFRRNPRYSYSDGAYRSLTLYLTLGVLVLPAILLAIAAWSAWRDPDNWVLDAERRKIRFKNWTELSAYGVILTIILLCLMLFML